MPAPEPILQPAAPPRLLIWLRLARAAALAVLLVAAGLYSYRVFFPPAAPAPSTDPAAESAPPDHGTPLDPPRELSDFSFTSQTGAPLGLRDLRGSYALLFFGYTHCPDVCPTTLADFVLVKRQLGTLADQVRFVFISVDGDRDTPAVLARFMNTFDPSFIGLRGDDATLARIGKEYGLYYKKEQVAGTSEPYLVTHSTSAYLLDRDNRMRMLYGFGTPPKVIADDIRSLLTSN